MRVRVNENEGKSDYVRVCVSTSGRDTNFW